MKKTLKKTYVLAACLVVAALFTACSDDEPTEQTPQPENKDEIQLPVSGTINGHDYVDLGLSVKWATCNVGATNSSEKGSFFAWGETKEKESYSKETYSFFDNNTGRSIYIEYDDIKGTKYDAAHVQWGGSWRIPTRADFAELINKCTSQATTFKGADGILFTASNGNCVFIPLSGEKYNGNLYGGEYHGVYWTSEGDTRLAYPFNITSSANQTGVYSSWNGLAIRPVTD